MKKYSIILTGLVCLLCITSCKKNLLDKRPLDGFDEATIWEDAGLAKGYVYSTYESVIGGLYYNQQYMDDWSDDNVRNDAISAVNINRDVVGLNDFGGDWSQYGRIRRTNIIIQKVTNSPGIAAADKKVLIAEAKFLRALIYFYMAKRFGGVMLVDTVYDQTTTNFTFPRASIEGTYNFILKDLDAAAADLPSTADLGLATKYAAHAMITRVGLQAAAYVPAKKAEYLQKVIASGQIVANSGNYSMDADYAGMFNDFAKSSASKEIILIYQRKAVNTTFGATPMQYLVTNIDNTKLKTGYFPPFNEEMLGWVERFPSQGLVDAYEVNDADGKSKKWDQTSFYTNYQANGGYASQVLYKNRDKRFYATVVYDSSKMFGNMFLTREFGSTNKNANRLSTWAMSECNYYYRKTVYEAKKVFVDDKTDHHTAIIRLGEVYLNLSEALIQSGRAVESVPYINALRDKHGGLTALATGLDNLQIEQFYKNERRVDMVLEGDRYWSLLRWAKFANQTIIPELNTPVRGVNISADGKTFSFFDVTENFNNQRIWNPRRFLLPVPESEIIQNPKLAPQNPLWN